MRKEVTSATLELEEVAVLGIIAKREHKGNRSAALRAIVRESAEKRGLWTPAARPNEGVHSGQPA
jgi:hypothetical protein